MSVFHAVAVPYYDILVGRERVRGKVGKVGRQGRLRKQATVLRRI